MLDYFYWFHGSSASYLDGSGADFTDYLRVLFVGVRRCVLDDWVQCLSLIVGSSFLWRLWMWRKLCRGVGSFWIGFLVDLFPGYICRIFTRFTAGEGSWIFIMSFCLKWKLLSLWWSGICCSPGSDKFLRAQSVMCTWSKVNWCPF